MDEPSPVFTTFFVVLFLAAWITSAVAWFRMVKAQDRKTYWKNIALFTGPILLVFLVANTAGLFPELDFESHTAPGPPELRDVPGAMPPLQKFYLGAAAATWLIGANVLFVTHNRRTKKKWWHQLNPLNPPFKDFNRREWAILLALTVVTMVFGMAGTLQWKPAAPVALSESMPLTGSGSGPTLRQSPISMLK